MWGKRTSNSKAVFPGCYFRYWTEGWGPPLSVGRPLFLSAVVVALVGHIPCVVVGSKNRVEIVRTDHVVAEIDSYPVGIGVLMLMLVLNVTTVDWGRCHYRHSRIRVVTIAVKTFRQLSLGNSDEKLINIFFFILSLLFIHTKVLKI